jgi:hypothetical protein
MRVIPPVRAELAERFIFNFRMPPHALARFLPVPWLEPQVVNGYGVVSFCLLDLRHITVAPLPTVAGINSISCAPRFAVSDRSRGVARPAVYVNERRTSSGFGAWFTSLGFSAPHPFARVSVRRDDGGTTLQVADRGERVLFSGSARACAGLGSELFASADDFAAFVAAGVTSYGACRHEGRLTRVDLHKQDNTYEPLEADGLAGPFVEAWTAAGGVLDSAFRTHGGRYEWIYHGLVDAATGSPAHARRSAAAAPPIPAGAA